MSDAIIAALKIDQDRIDLYATPGLLIAAPLYAEQLRGALRTLVVMIERQWRAEGWSCAETSGQVPLDELNARNEARRLLGEPYEEEGRS